MRYKVEDVESWFQNFLGSISLNENAQQLLLAMIKERIGKQTKQNDLGAKHYESIKDLEDKLVKLQDLLVDGSIERNDYTEAKKRYEDRLMELKEKESQQKETNDIPKTYNQGLKKLESIDSQFIEANIDHKRKLLGSIFPEKFQFEKNEVRTADINPILLKIASINKGFKGNKKGTNQKNLICPA